MASCRAGSCAWRPGLAGRTARRRRRRSRSVTHCRRRGRHLPQRCARWKRSCRQRRRRSLVGIPAPSRLDLLSLQKIAGGRLARRSLRAPWQELPQAQRLREAAQTDPHPSPPLAGQYDETLGSWLALAGYNWASLKADNVGANAWPSTHRLHAKGGLENLLWFPRLPCHALVHSCAPCVPASPRALQEGEQQPSEEDLQELLRGAVQSNSGEGTLLWVACASSLLTAWLAGARDLAGHLAGCRLVPKGCARGPRPHAAAQAGVAIGSSLQLHGSMT